MYFQELCLHFVSNVDFVMTCENFFNGKNVLVTGATGFVGKVLVEKLLRSCASIESVYILIRTKKNEKAQQRYKKFVDHVAFDTIRKLFPERLSKLKVVSGDISADGLGLSGDDKHELAENVNIIFHCAALVRFDFSLMEALKTNLKGTHRVLQLAEISTHLESFVYVSTSFCQAYQMSLEEKYYSTGFDVFALISFIESNDKRSIDDVEKELFKKGHPSTYTMSKALAEELIYKYGFKLPVAVVRPSIIVGAFKDPQPGYVQGLQSTTGVLAGFLSGIFRTFILDIDANIKMIPVDFAVNLIISVAWERSDDLQKECTFYNCTDSPSNQTSFRELNTHLHKIYDRFVPYEKMLCHPSLFITRNVYVYALVFFLTQFIPGICFDIFLMLSGRKVFMTKLQKNIFYTTMDFCHFTNNNYEIEIGRMQKLYNKMSESDQEIFFFDVEQIDWNRQLEKHLGGIRKLIFEEDESTLPNAQAKLKRLYFVLIVVKILIALCVCYVTMNFFNN